MSGSAYRSPTEHVAQTDHLGDVPAVDSAVERDRIPEHVLRGGGTATQRRHAWRRSASGAWGLEDACALWVTTQRTFMPCTFEVSQSSMSSLKVEQAGRMFESASKRLAMDVILLTFQALMWP